MKPGTPVDAGPSGLALPLALAASVRTAPAARPAEIRSGSGRGRRAARRRAAAVRG